MSIRMDNIVSVKDGNGVKYKQILDGLTRAVLWQASSEATYTPIMPDDSAYPMLVVGDDGNPTFAVTDGTRCGYYCPATNTFVEESGMTGTVIERVEYIEASGSQYVDTGVCLGGSDEVTIDFDYTKTGQNIFGSWRSSNDDVYSLYASTNSSYVRYASSLYRNTPISIDVRHTFRMTPTGDYVDGTRYHTWAESDFQSDVSCHVCWLKSSSSNKMTGKVYDFLIKDRCHLVPVKVGDTFYLFDVLRWTMPVHVGTFDGGDVIDMPIPFPTVIPS